MSNNRFPVPDQVRETTDQFFRLGSFGFICVPRCFGLVRFSSHFCRILWWFFLLNPSTAEIRTSRHPVRYKVPFLQSAVNDGRLKMVSTLGRFCPSD